MVFDYSVENNNNMSNKKIAVIGGGISGLAAAYSLEEMAQRKGKSISITLFEKNNRIGGNILTERVGDFLIEGGPDCFLSEKPWAIQLCEWLGMGESLLRTNDEYRRTYIYWKGRLRELPEGIMLMIPTRFFPLLKSDLFSLAGKLRMGMELFIPKRKSGGDESLSEFVRRRLGQEIVERVAEPLVAGVHAENPDAMSIKSRFPRFVQMEEEYGSLIKGMLAKRKIMLNSESGKPKWTMFMTLKNGLDELPLTIVKALKMTTIITNKEVSEINKVSGYKIYLKNRDTIDADVVIFATPSYETGRLLRGLNSSISDQLDTIPYVSTATISLAYKKDSILHPMNGFGFLVPRVENRRIMGASWVSRKFSYRTPDDSILIRCFIGGSRNEELVFLDDKDMLKMIREELRDVMGISAEPILTRIYRWEKAMPQYIIGHDERVSRIEQSISKYPDMFVTGSAYRGGGISECIKNAQLTAESVLKYLNL
ncbi:MAG TPA: protoporphyrinogen oxidase [Nitrospinae bacterium]|nr:protoporphyrinogen oxidase [Nitrospinota bacterium]HBA27368.1 protoporphyrinogen oxidase [Nitrospinota bacterium]